MLSSVVGVKTFIIEWDVFDKAVLTHILQLYSFVCVKSLLQWSCVVCGHCGRFALFRVLFPLFSVRSTRNTADSHIYPVCSVRKRSRNTAVDDNNIYLRVVRPFRWHTCCVRVLLVFSIYTPARSRQVVVRNAGNRGSGW